MLDYLEFVKSLIFEWKQTNFSHKNHNVSMVKALWAQIYYIIEETHYILKQSEFLLFIHCLFFD